MENSFFIISLFLDDLCLIKIKGVLILKCVFPVLFIELSFDGLVFFGVLKCDSSSIYQFGLCIYTIAIWAKYLIHNNTLDLLRCYFLQFWKAFTLNCVFTLKRDFYCLHSEYPCYSLRETPTYGIFKYKSWSMLVLGVGVLCYYVKFY